MTVPTGFASALSKSVWNILYAFVRDSSGTPWLSTSAYSGTVRAHRPSFVRMDLLPLLPGARTGPPFDARYPAKNRPAAAIHDWSVRHDRPEIPGGLLLGPSFLFDGDVAARSEGPLLTHGEDPPPTANACNIRRCSS